MTKNNVELKPKSTRIEWLTTAQVISMLLVVFHHSIPNYTASGKVFTVIASNVHLFALAVFFWISGYLAEKSIKKESTKEYITKRLFKLMVPFVCINLLMLAPPTQTYASVYFCGQH